jgi:transmembrane sensor
MGFFLFCNLIKISRVFFPYVVLLSKIQNLMSIRHPYNKNKIPENTPESRRMDEIINNSLSSFKVPGSGDKNEAWLKLEKRLGADVEKKVRVAYFKLYAIAASVCFLIAGSYIFNILINKTVICPRGKQIVIMLPDMSTVKLNSSTKVNYNLMNWKKNRRITLEGEAFFEVKKGQKFEVVTKQGTISVLGTSFNVFARDNCLNVVCKSGVVAVSNQEKVILKAGEGCKNTKDIRKFELYKPIVAKQTGWINGKFWFENTLLIDVLKEIERQFNVNLSYNDTTKRYYTGYFTNADLDEALKLVCLPMQLDYKKNRKEIIIKSKFN